MSPPEINDTNKRSKIKHWGMQEQYLQGLIA
jgi:hypothetical protein